MDTVISGKHVTYCTPVTIRCKCIDMVFVGLSDDSFVITEFEHLFTVFVYDFSVLSNDLIFVNDCEFFNLLSHYLAHAIVI